MNKIVTLENLEIFAEINDTLKADKAVEAITGNLAKFDENGNPVDSGININDLSLVATTGDYNDLLNKPSIPSVGNAEIEIQKNGTKINSFTTNQSGSKVSINITVPTGTAADKNVPSSGDASSTQVVLGNDSRLTNARPASDVSSWAKASSKPSYTKSEVGLGNVTNDTQVKRTEMGAASGVATLGTDGKVPSSQLPSYVDDVLEYAKLSSFPATGESGKIYVAQDTNKTYRWSGSAYVEISPSIVIGTTTGTAFDGKSGYDHVNNTANPHGVTKSQVGLGNVGNFKAVSTEASQGLSSTEQANARANIGAGTSSFSGNYNDLSNKPTIPAAVTESTVSDWGFTKNTGTITGIKMNGSSKGTSGVVDLGTVITTHQDISGKVDKTTTVNGHALSGNVSVTKSDVGLGSVGNFKAVSTVASQGLTDTEKSNARANIGAGTSSFSGSYNDLSNKPTIPAAQIQSDWNQTDNTAKDFIKNKPTIVPAEVEIVADDTATIAADTKIVIEEDTDGLDTLVYTKAQTDSAINTRIQEVIGAAPAALDTLEEIAAKLGDDDSAIAAITNTLSLKANSADLATVATSGSYNDLSNKPTIPTVPTNVSAFTNDAGYLTSETPEVQINGTPASGIKLLVDETADASVEVYSKAQVDAMIANIYLILINNGLTV